jgi:predicted dehydrogenase
MSESKVRIGLVGLRGINMWLYLPALRTHPRVELVAGCDVSPEATEKFGAENGVPVFASLPEMAARVKLDGVFIGTPNPAHLPNIREGAAARVNLCVTKPLTNTVAEAREAIELCRQAGIVLATGHEYRYRPEMAEIRRRIAAGELGEVTQAYAFMGHQGGLGKLVAAPNAWRASRQNVPGGCANLLAIHGFDAVNAVLGEPVCASATMKRLVTASPLDDTTAHVFEYASGKVGVVGSSYVCSPSDWMHIYGTQANLFTHTTTRSIFIEKEGRLALTALPASPGSGYGVLDMFVRAIRGEAPPETGGREGLIAVAMLEASLRSQESGRRVPLAEVLS